MNKLNVSSIAVCLLLLSSCGNNEKNNNQSKSDARETIPVRYAVSREINYTPYLHYTGSAFASKEANLGATLPGKITKIYVKPGQYVRKGQLLVEMSAELLLQAQIEYDAIQKDFERVSRLRDKESVSQQDFDHLKAKKDAVAQKVALIKNSTHIRAPFSGLVTEVLVHEGENYLMTLPLKPGLSHTSGILRLMKTNPLIIKCELNEKDLSSVHIGQTAHVQFDALGDFVIEGRVSNIIPLVSSISRTASVEISINNSQGKVYPGMFARVDFLKPERKVVSVPYDALKAINGSELKRVFILRGNKVKSKDVKVIEHLDDQVIVDGLNTGEKIVISGKNKVYNGAVVSEKSEGEK